MIWIVVLPLLIVVLLARLASIPLRRPPVLLGALAVAGFLIAVLLALTPLRTWQDATIGRQLECGSVLRPTSGEEPCPHARRNKALNVAEIVGAAAVLGGAGAVLSRRTRAEAD
jgi:hypothetical protein